MGDLANGGPLAKIMLLNRLDGRPHGVWHCRSDPVGDEISYQLSHRAIVRAGRHNAAFVVAVSGALVQNRMGLDQSENRLEIAPQAHRDRRDSLSEKRGVR